MKGHVEEMEMQSFSNPSLQAEQTLYYQLILAVNRVMQFGSLSALGLSGFNYISVFLVSRLTDCTY